LKIDIERAGLLSAIEVANTYFYAKISQGFEDVARYTSHSSFQVYRHMGHMLATGALDLLAFLANLNRNHWVAVVLDFKKDIIWYGDSLGGKIPTSMEKILKWWTKFHSSKDFTVKKLTITIQKDFFSCCLLAWNALCVFFFQKTSHLIPAERVAEERLKMLLRILHHHQAGNKVRITYLSCFYLS
jgi:Ulp1 family protease catalytic subunit